MAGESDRAVEHIRKLSAGEGSVTCGVCGQGLSGKVSACSQCDTPYHPDCWTYQGGCSVFGCREAPRRPDPVAVEIVIGGPAKTWPSPLRQVVWAVLLLGAGGVMATSYHALTLRGRTLPVAVVPSPVHVVEEITKKTAGPPETSPSDPAVLANAPSIEEFMKSSKGAEWEGKVFFLKNLVKTRDKKALSYLLEGLRAENEIGNVREAAAQTLGLGGWKEAVPALEERLDRESVGAVRSAIAIALHRLGSPLGIRFMKQCMDQCVMDYAPVQGTLRGEEARKAMRAGNRNEQAAVGMQAAAEAGITELRPQIERLLGAKDPWILGIACYALGKMKHPESAPLVKRLLSHKDEGVVNNAAEALAELGAADAWPEVEQAVARCEHGASYLPHLKASFAKLSSQR